MVDSTRSPSGSPHWEMALHCRFGCVCHGSFVIQHTSAPSVMGLVNGKNWDDSREREMPSGRASEPC